MQDVFYHAVLSFSFLEHVVSFLNHIPFVKGDSDGTDNTSHSFDSHIEENVLQSRCSCSYCTIQEYVMGALSGKTVILVTHQVDFLPAFDSVLLMSNGKILDGDLYHILLASSQKFLALVNVHKDTSGPDSLVKIDSSHRRVSSPKETGKSSDGKQLKESLEHQLIKQEEKEARDIVWKPYIQYLNQNRGFMYFSLVIFCQITFDQLLNSLFHAPIAFYESTPLGRILSMVSSDLSILDLDLPFCFAGAFLAFISIWVNLGVVSVLTWQVLFVYVPVVYMVIHLQRYYSASAKEFMRISGTTKSLVASHLGESIAGAVTIRAFKEEDRFFTKNLDLIDRFASPAFHIFAASEWLIQRLEILCAVLLCSSALVMVLLPPKTFGPGFVGMALSYGLSLNMFLIVAMKAQCTLSDNIISVERLYQ